MANNSTEKPAPVVAGIKVLSSALGVQLLYLVMSYVNGLRESVPVLLFEGLILSLVMLGLIYAVSTAKSTARMYIAVIALAGLGFGIGRFTQDYSSENLIFILSFLLTAGSLIFLFRRPASEWFSGAGSKAVKTQKSPG